MHPAIPDYHILPHGGNCCPAHALVTKGSLKTFTSGINQASNPIKYEYIKTSIGLFQILTAPQQAVRGSGITPENVAKIIKTSANRVEKKRLKSGHTKCLAFLIVGEVDFKVGTVTSLVLSTLTQAYNNALQEPTIVIWRTKTSCW